MQLTPGLRALILDKSPLCTDPDLAAELNQQGVTVSALLSEVETLVGLSNTVPCSGASAERAFSALKQAKIYLRSTELQIRLTHLLMPFTHQKEPLSISNQHILAECPRPVPPRGSSSGVWTKVGKVVWYVIGLCEDTPPPPSPWEVETHLLHLPQHS